MISHSVFFKLNHEKGSASETLFLNAAAELSKIQGVENFRIVEEKSLKNNFEFGLTMEFQDQSAYDRYNAHPDHVAFVEDIWLQEVACFQEIDYVPLKQQPYQES